MQRWFDYKNRKCDRDFTHLVLHNLKAAAKISPKVLSAYHGVLWNRVGTAARFQTKGSTCSLCGAEGSEDRIEHWPNCFIAIFWASQQLLNLKRPWAPLPAETQNAKGNKNSQDANSSALALFFGLGTEKVEAEELNKIILLMYMMYTLHNEVKHGLKFDLQDEYHLKDLGARLAENGARGCRAATNMLENLGTCGSNLPKPEIKKKAAEKNQRADKGDKKLKAEKKQRTFVSGHHIEGPEEFM